MISRGPSTLTIRGEEETLPDACDEEIPKAPTVHLYDAMNEPATPSPITRPSGLKGPTPIPATIPASTSSSLLLEILLGENILCPDISARLMRGGTRGARVSTATDWVEFVDNKTGRRRNGEVTLNRSQIATLVKALRDLSA